MPKSVFASIVNARLLVVDDEERNVRVLEAILKRSGFGQVVSTTDPREAVDLYTSFQPDIVLLDLRMPHLDGFALMNALQAVVPEESFLPLVVLTADITTEARQSALAAGASDFLTKPFDAAEVVLRVRNLLKTRFLTLNLEVRVKERTREIRETQHEVLERLARASEFRDDDTGQHTQRVGHASALLAKALGQSDEQITLLRRTAPLHDVGKIGVADGILLKPGRLSDEELVLMRRHTLIGADLLSGGRSELMHSAQTIALNHHEHWNGAGYPNGLSGEEIPLEGRIVTVVDVFDALTHQRPYKPAWSLLDSLSEIRCQSGRQFDPQVVEAFMTLKHDELG